MKLTDEYMNSEPGAARTSRDRLVPETGMSPLDEHRIIWITDGSGSYEVDFRSYTYQGPRILFLGPGQYIRVLSGALDVQAWTIPSALVGQVDPAKHRVLFVHVFEAGAIVPSDSFRNSASTPGTDMDIAPWLDRASRAWREQRPLNPTMSDRQTDLVFDLRETVERYFREQRSVADYARALGLSTKWLNRTTSRSIDRTVSELVRDRKLLQAKRELVFTDRTVREIARDLDICDPAYLSRFLSEETGQPPTAFRRRFQSRRVDPVVQDVLDLIERNFRHDRSVQFYADRVYMTAPALSEKMKRLTGKPLGTLIRDRVVAEAGVHLVETDMQVQEIGWMLGFDDPSHFSHFFKNATGRSPQEYRDISGESGFQPPTSRFVQGSS